MRFYKLAPALDPDAPTDLRGHGGPATKQRQEEHRRRKESGEPREKGKKPVKEKTFWEKNWMYIVPISFLVSNALSALSAKGEEGMRQTRSLSATSFPSEGQFEGVVRTKILRI